jgi:ribosomal protein L16 Arg81 hydroxylase
MDFATDLESLIAPIPPPVFFSEYWNRRSVHIPGRPDKFHGLFDASAFHRASERCELLKINYTDRRGLPAEQRIQAAQIPAMLAAGRTVCAGGLDHVDPNLQAFVANFSRHFRQMGKFYFNSYLSPAGKGFGLHADDHPVWILQIEGNKRWWYSEAPGLPGLVSTVTFPDGVKVQRLPWGTVARPDESTFLEAILNPGDILYLPAGAWHRAEAIGGSLGLTLAELPATAVDVIQQAILPRVRYDTLLRNALPGFPAEACSNGSVPPELEQNLESALQRMRALAASLTAADLYESWRHGKVQEKAI